MNLSSLSGKHISIHNLTGKSTNDHYTNIPDEIKKIKIKILNIYVLPFLSKRWSVIKENMFLLDQLRNKIDFYYQCYKIEDLLLYKNLLSVFDVFIQQHTQLEELEQKVYGTTSTKGTKDQLINMVYRTTMIKLKPEYELYDAIFGKPKRDQRQYYREEVIADIQKYMILDNIDFKNIKDYIDKKYPSI
uniref:Uncharacterized protein n=1 Tax=viral metagenome TaxID=1070528 RepID=A0A6C0E225_9ZZZZ